jgi:general secretion pathway protein G
VAHEAEVQVRVFKRNSGFTLVELLVVLVVIAILAALVAPNVLQHVGTAKDAAARSQIEMFSGALDAYRLDNGRYPTSDQGLGALWNTPSSEPRPTNWRGPYIRKDVPLDPWGRAYGYRSPAQHSRLGYDLWSLGADGAEGGTGEAADVKNW